MPSAHSAIVSSLAGSVLIHCGIESVEFAIAAVLAIIVCRDAMGVRKEVEKHAIILKWMKTNCDIDLELEIGHDGLEVFAGIVLGIIVAFQVNISLHILQYTDFVWKNIYVFFTKNIPEFDRKLDCFLAMIKMYQGNMCVQLKGELC